MVRGDAVGGRRRFDDTIPFGAEPSRIRGSFPRVGRDDECAFHVRRLSDRGEEELVSRPTMLPTSLPETRSATTGLS